MICITIDGLNWIAAEECYKNLFPEQSMKKILCNVRSLTEPYQVNATPPGLVTLWSGEKTKNLHKNIFRKSFEDNTPIEFLDKDGDPLDLIWSHFNRTKLYEKVIGPNPYADNTEYWVHYHNLKKLGVKFVPSEELCIFSEVAKRDYDLFWIHSSIVKGGVPFPGPYENTRIPSLISYDTIRKDKKLKRDVYMMGVRRYKEIMKYLLEIYPDEIIVVCSDHGTMIDVPMTPNQIDEIPIIINRKVDLEDVNFQWDVKNLLLSLAKEEKKKEKPVKGKQIIKDKGISKENILGDMPLMRQSEIDKILSYLKPEYIMFEWGSGGSTLYFPKFVKKYYSVESQEPWFSMVRHFIGKDEGLRTKVLLNHTPIPSYEYSSTTLTHDDFKDYVECIKLVQDKLDVILVDGENKSRVFCALEALKYIDENTIVFIHDYYSREELHKQVEEHYDVIDKAETLVVLRKKK